VWLWLLWQPLSITGSTPLATRTTGQVLLTQYSLSYAGDHSHLWHTSAI
jgi:hypothetical protein